MQDVLLTNIFEKDDFHNKIKFKINLRWLMYSSAKTLEYHI